MLFAVLAFAAVVLTYALFQSRNSMLGFPSALMWAILGGYAYTESTATWDLYFIFAFACLLGMTTFCALGAYGLRERRDSIADRELEKGEGKYIDENKSNSDKKETQDKTWYEDDGIPDRDSSERSQPTGSRTERRRSSAKRKGEFDW